MKTTAEAAKEFCEKRRLDSRGYPPSEWFKEGVKFAEQWIDVNDELPEIKDEMYMILVQYINDQIDVWYIVDEEEHESLKKNCKSWRPLNRE